MATQEQIILGDLENTRENAREAVKTLNDLETKLTRTRSTRSQAMYSGAITSIKQWLEQNGHTIESTAGIWSLVRTPEEEAALEARLRLYRTRLYVSMIQKKQQEIRSRLDGIKQEIESKIDDCNRGYWRLGTNALTVSAREIELCYQELELTTEILMNLGALEGLTDPL